MHRNTTYQQKNLDFIYRQMARLNNPAEIGKLFEALFTPAELEDLAARWEILKRLHRGDTQRKIAGELHLGLCKITRGSKELKKEGSVVKEILNCKE
ncbi:MAG: transcriptional regulator [Calditrichaeota bacterium]|nr:MAG: transcriptional regulator [Calditrichota bacterium]